MRDNVADDAPTYAAPEGAWSVRPRAWSGGDYLCM